MFNGLITACDACATPLEGRVGTADIIKPYLVIKGNIGKIVVGDDKYDDGYLFWAKRKDDFSQLHFCNEACLIGYVEGKIILVKQFQEKKLDWGYDT